MGLFGGKKDPYRKLKKAIGDHKVLDRMEDRMVYAVDASYTAPPGNHDPDVVVLPENREDVVQAILFARDHEMKIVPRGTGTGMSAGSVPIGGGMVISTERLTRIIGMNASERWIQVEPGLTTAVVKEAAAKERLIYPPDPSSYKISSIGGNIAENAGGLRCVKYGTTKDYVLGLVYVDTEGELQFTGELKTDTTPPYDLTPLLVGSEGLFGIIVEAKLRLIPAPKATYTVLAHYADPYQVLDAVAMFLPELTPSVCEFMDGAVINAIREHDPYPFPEGTEAALLVETDGELESAKREAQRVLEVLRDFHALEVHSAKNPQERERLWNLRRLISPALSRIADGKHNEDVVVPMGNMPALLEQCAAIAEEFDVQIPIYGHAGDGNLHLNVMYDKADTTAANRAHEALIECFRVVVGLGGTISGEHGIGASKNRYMHQQFSDDEIEVFFALKRALDPDNFFNPYKALPLTK